MYIMSTGLCSVSEKIRRLVNAEFERSKLSQGEAAERAGMTRATLNRYLNGKQEITTATLDALLAVFGKELKAVKRQLED